MKKHRIVYIGNGWAVVSEDHSIEKTRFICQRPDRFNETMCMGSLTELFYRHKDKSAEDMMHLFGLHPFTVEDDPDDPDNPNWISDSN